MSRVSPAPTRGQPRSEAHAKSSRIELPLDCFPPKDASGPGQIGVPTSDSPAAARSPAAPLLANGGISGQTLSMERRYVHERQRETIADSVAPVTEEHFPIPRKFQHPVTVPSSPLRSGDMSTSASE